MNTFFPAILLMLLVSGAAFAQTKTTETRSTKDTTINGVTTSVTTTISETEDITPHNNILTVSPVKYIVFYNLTYYRKFSDMWVIGAGLSGPTFGGKISNSTSIGGYGFNLEARYYPKGTAPLGFYIAPNFYYNTVSVTDGTNYEYLWMTGGILLGFQFFPTQDFSVGCGIGVDYFVPTEKRNGQTLSIDNQDIPGARMLPAIRFDFGYAWK